MNFVCANIEREQSMQIDILPALKDFLDAYNDHAEMVVTEAVANAIDVKASEISVMLKADVNDNMTVSFHNNGPSMNKKQFDDYHVIARSSKSKGSGIGFAGIGAKVYLAAWQEGTVIRTETTDGHATYASEMYVKNNVLKYAHVNPTIKKLGTAYTVRLKADDYRKLDKSLNQIIVDTFSPAIMNGLTVLVDGKRVKTMGTATHVQKDIYRHCEWHEVSNHIESHKRRHSCRQTVFPIPCVGKGDNHQKARMVRRSAGKI